MAENLKVNVLGTEYEIHLNVARDTNPIFEEADGTINLQTKVISIPEMEIGEEDGYEIRRKQVIRHELIHAFLFESGLYFDSEWAVNETLVDWISLQFPKMVKAFEELEVLK